MARKGWRTLMWSVGAGLLIAGRVAVANPAATWMAWAGLQVATEPAAGKQIRLELWTWALRPWFNEYMADLIAAFEKENPGVRINWVDVPGDTIVRKYFAAGAAGKLPDVVNLPDKVFLRFANLGGLRALDDLLPGDPRTVYVGPAMDQCTVSGHIYGLPWYLSTDISVMNTALLERGGLTPETVGKTWDELLAQSRDFHSRTGEYLVTMRLGDIDLLSMVTAAGLHPLRRQADGVFQSNLLDAEVVAVLEKWVRAYREGDLPREAATADYPAVVQAFKEQHVAILNADAVRSVRSDAPRVYEVMAVRPGITGKIGKTNISAVQLGVSPQSRHPDLAAKLAWFMSSAPWQERLCRQASRVPATKASLGLADFSLPVDTADKLRLAIGLGCEQVRTERSMSFIPPTGKWPDMESVFSDEIKRALLEGVSTRDCLVRIDRAWNKLLAGEAGMMRAGMKDQR